MAEHTKPWLVLASVTCAQLMIGVDATILAVALPQIVADLALDPAATAWVMAGYVLASGSLMIPAGRVAQSVGYARTMVVGLVLFALASIVGGLAQASLLLVAARVGQGVAAAAVTPAAMARLSGAFPGADRPRAYGIFGTVMGAGTAIGLTLGGVLTQYGGWRACMMINVVFVAVALLLGGAARDHSPGGGAGGIGAWRGLLLGTGIASLIQAMTRTDRPESALVWLLGSVLVLATFARAERRAHRPLLPVSLLASPRRRTAYLALLLWGIATIATFVAVSGSLQDAHHLGPMGVGLLVLVYPAAIQTGLFITRRAPTLSPVAAMGVGLALIGAGQVLRAIWPGSIAADLFGLGIMGLGTAQVMPTANSEMNRDAGHHAGVAGAVGTTLQQLGASVGLALPTALTPFAANPGRLSTALTAAALTLAAASILARARRHGGDERRPRHTMG